MNERVDFFEYFFLKFGRFFCIDNGRYSEQAWELWAGHAPCTDMVAEAELFSDIAIESARSACA